MSEQRVEYKIEGREATIFRVIKSKENPYVMVDRRPIDNPDLSFKAKGILTYLLSRPDGWEVNVPDLVNHSTDGAAAIRTGLKELRTAGHIHYNTQREGGYIKKWVIEVYELPRTELNPVPEDVTDKVLDDDFQQVENLQVGNRGEVLSTLNSTESSIKTTTTGTTGSIFKVYEQEIGAITPMVSQRIGGYIDDPKCPSEWIADAINEASRQNKRNWAYCEAILNRWMVEGKQARVKLPSGPKYPQSAGKSFLEKLAEA
jgi:DnaD/phage-associated family protein